MYCTRQLLVILNTYIYNTPACPLQVPHADPPSGHDSHQDRAHPGPRKPGSGSPKAHADPPSGHDSHQDRAHPGPRKPGSGSPKAHADPPSGHDSHQDRAHPSTSRPAHHLFPNSNCDDVQNRQTDSKSDDFLYVQPGVFNLVTQGAKHAKYLTSQQFDTTDTRE